MLTQPYTSYKFMDKSKMDTSSHHIAISSPAPTKQAKNATQTVQEKLY